MTEINKLLIKESDADFNSKIFDLKKKWSFADFIAANGQICSKVKDIVDTIGREGDKALSDFTSRFDNVELTSADFRISPEQLKQAFDSIDKDLLCSLRKAISNVKDYQSSICIANKPKTEGIKYMPIQRVGICVPGASAPLPSTVIMTAVPAIVAGVKDIVVVSPPRHNNSIDPVILGLCYELGIKEVYRVGGAQAVAAMAWGTETIKKVDMIVGPGNNYVQMAKKEVVGLVKIDSFAGPSDVIIIANDQANPVWVAADMLSQAEHYPGAAIVITDSEKLAQEVLSQVKTQLANLSRSEQTKSCLINDSAIIVTKDITSSINLANDLAAEHLEIQCGKDSNGIAEKITNAGAIFIGEFTPVAVGDYIAGPSHTLPTLCTSKFFSALTCNDFLKSSSLIRFDKQQLQAVADDIIRMAGTEGLDAHAESIRKRLK